jgi:hypothetical protein
MNLKQEMAVWVKTVWGTDCEVFGVDIINARYQLLIWYDTYYRAEWTHISFIRRFYESHNSVFSTI